MRSLRPFIEASADGKREEHIMKIKLFVLALAASTLSGLAVEAHHSFAGTYDLKRQIKVEGTLLRVQFRNPHSFVTVKGPDDTGAMHEWSIEWSGLPALAGAGVTSKTIMVGDPVIITGNPSRTVGEHRLRMVTFLRTSDGFAWGNKKDEVVN
jgi:hypothetical protein